MERKYLGVSGLEISPLCLGTMNFGKETSAAEAKSIVDAVVDLGINTFDCANVYARGESERILGKLLQGQRKSVVITTKSYFPTADKANHRGNSKKHMISAVEESLQRLGTDWVDIYFIHRFDDFTPLKETLRGIEQLLNSGKILYWGVSNFAAWQTVKIAELASQMGIQGPSCIQPMYNILKTQCEVEILPMAISEGLGVLTYSPLGGGMLTGKYLQGIESGRLKENPMYNDRYNGEKNHQIVADFVQLAQELQCSPISLAVRWVLERPGVSAPIIAARNLQDLVPSLEALKIPYNSEIDQKIRDLIPPLPPLNGS